MDYASKIDANIPARTSNHLWFIEKSDKEHSFTIEDVILYKTEIIGLF